MDIDVSVDVDVDEILSSASRREKMELLKGLLEDSDLAGDDEVRKHEKDLHIIERQQVLNYLIEADGYKLKCLLCDLMCISYNETDRLREGLEKIITAV